jgi:hypothetical protein
MRLPEDGPKCEPKYLTTVKYNQCEQFDWFISVFIGVLTAKYRQFRSVNTHSAAYT